MTVCATIEDEVERALDFVEAAVGAAMMAGIKADLLALGIAAGAAVAS